MGIRHVGSNPLKEGSSSSFSVLAVPGARKRRKSTRRKTESETPAQGEAVVEVPAASEDGTEAPARTAGTRRKSTRRPRKDPHIAGAPEDMDQGLREEFRGALRTSLSTNVAPVDETRIASLELRLAAMENTGRDESARNRVGELGDHLELLESRLDSSPWFDSEIGDQVIALQTRLEALEARLGDRAGNDEIATLRRDVEAFAELEDKLERARDRHRSTAWPAGSTISRAASHGCSRATAAWRRGRW
jgi:hypothetical protein